MRRIIARTFYKNRYIKIKVFFTEKRMRTYYVLPSAENTVTITENGGDFTFTIDTECVIYENGEPVYYYNSVCPYPAKFNLDEKEYDMIQYNPIELNSAIETNVIKDLIKSFKKEEKLSLGVLLSIITFLATLGVGYYLYTQIENLRLLIEQMKIYLELLGGIDIG